MNADTLNEHLQKGGIIQITTYTRSTIYTHKHAGMFFTGKDGNLYVKRGRSKDCLTMAHGTVPLVAIRLGRWKEAKEESPSQKGE